MGPCTQPFARFVRASFLPWIQAAVGKETMVCEVSPHDLQASHLQAVTTCSQPLQDLEQKRPASVNPTALQLTMQGVYTPPNKKQKARTVDRNVNVCSQSNKGQSYVQMLCNSNGSQKHSLSFKPKSCHDYQDPAQQVVA